MMSLSDAKQGDVGGIPQLCFGYFCTGKSINTYICKWIYQITMQNKKDCNDKLQSFWFQKLRFYFDNLFALVRAASLTSSVRHLEFAASWTLNHTWDNKLPVSSSLISSCLRSLSLWNCHFIYTSFCYALICIRDIP